MGDCNCMCLCEDIAKIRADERSRWDTPWFSHEYHRGYRQGQDDHKKVTMDDYLELPLHLDEGNTVTDLWVYTIDGSPIVLKDVTGDPVRYQGWWVIGYHLVGIRASAHIPAEGVRYFTVVEGPRS